MVLSHVDRDSVTLPQQFGRAQRHPRQYSHLTYHIQCADVSQKNPKERSHDRRDQERRLSDLHFNKSNDFYRKTQAYARHDFFNRNRVMK